MKQRVLITAGAAGIGLAMANCFLKNNASVWVTDINQEALKALPDGVQGSCVNVCDEVGMRDLFCEIMQSWGGLDVLCANAGIAGPTAAIDEISLKDESQNIAMIIQTLSSNERDVPEYLQLELAKCSVKFIRGPQLSDVPYAVVMEPNLVIEFYSR